MAVQLPGLNPTTTTDRSPSDGWIPSNALNVTRVTGAGSLIAGIAAAVAPIFPASAQDPLALQVTYAAARALIIVTSLLVAAIVVAVDVRTRGQVAAAAAATPAPAGAAAAGDATANPTPTAMLPLPQQLQVRVTGLAGTAQALAIRPAAAGGIEYLVAHSGARPDWFPDGSVEVV